MRMSRASFMRRRQRSAAGNNRRSDPLRYVDCVVLVKPISSSFSFFLNFEFVFAAASAQHARRVEAVSGLCARTSQIACQQLWVLLYRVCDACSGRSRRGFTSCTSASTTAHFVAQATRMQNFARATPRNTMADTYVARAAHVFIHPPRVCIEIKSQTMLVST